MISSSPPAKELAELLEAFCLGELVPEQELRLRELVCNDAECRNHYVLFMHMHALIERREGQAGKHSAEMLDACWDGPTETAVPISVPLLTSLDTTIHGPVGFFSSGWPVAYLVATVIFGIGLVVGSVVHVSEPVQVARQSVPLPPPLSSLPTVVGRIAGMVDCKWVQSPEARVQSPSLDSRLSSLVSLGDKFTLASGLMEIAYDTGAKVILQGPVTYEVESAAGGFLSVGKLTARVEKKNDECRMMNDELQTKETGIHHSSFITHHSFAVRTPTAIVTDLGTEFGVEVNKEGRTISHVFRGSVEVRTTSVAEGAEPAVRVLHANESAQVVTRVVGSQESAASEIRPIQVDAQQFIRQISHESPAKAKALPMQVVTWFRMGEDDPDAAAGGLASAMTINHRHNKIYSLQRQGSPHYTADTASPRSSLAMTFTAANHDYFAIPRWDIIPTDDFILETWARVRSGISEGKIEIIIHNGRTDRNGYGLLIKDATWHFMFGGCAFPDSGVACELGRWTHLALVCEHGKAVLWVDGRPTTAVYDGIPLAPEGNLQIGCSSRLKEFFDGEIDEVRLSVLLGPFQPEMLLYAPPTKVLQNGKDEAAKQPSSFRKEPPFMK